jgi:hypothetical protein
MFDELYFELSDIYESIQESYLNTLNAIDSFGMKQDQMTCFMEEDTSLSDPTKLTPNQIKRVLQSHVVNQNGGKVRFLMIDPKDKDPIEHQVFQLILPKVIALSKNRDDQKLKEDLFKHFGFKNGPKSVKLNWYTSGVTDTRIELHWLLQSSLDIFKKREGIRFFHQSETGGIKKLIPQNMNSYKNGANYDYGESAVFFYAIDMSDPKQKSIITNGHYGHHLYEYKPKPSDIFYLDKRDQGGRTENVHLMWKKFGGCPVFINTTKPLPVTEIDPKTIDTTGSNKALENKMSKFMNSKRYKSMKQFADDMNDDKEDVAKGNMSRIYRNTIDELNRYRKSNTDEDDKEELIELCNRTIKGIERRKSAMIQDLGKDGKITKSIRRSVGNYNYMISTIIGKARSKGIELKQQKIDIDKLSDDEVKALFMKKMRIANKYISEKQLKMMADINPIEDLREILKKGF